MKTTETVQIPATRQPYCNSERTSGTIRRDIVELRLLAMKGEVESAICKIDRSIAVLPPDDHSDFISMGMLKAEILRLDLKYEEAADVMECLVLSRVAHMKDEQRFAAESNLSDLSFYQPNRYSGYLFYDLGDRMQLSDFEWFDHRELSSAKLYAEKGKHFHVLPILWRQLRRVYDLGCWSAIKQAHRLLATESIQLKDWDAAVHHVILSGDDDTAKELSNELVLLRSIDLVTKVLDRLITTANLRGHFVVACRLIQKIHDLIPDEWISRLGEWALTYARDNRLGVFGVNPASEAWKTIAAVSFRYPSELAEHTLSVAFTHPAWTTKLDDPKHNSSLRADIVKAVSRMCYAFPIGDVEFVRISSESVQLLIDRPQDFDHYEVVDLLCHVSDRGGDHIRDALGAKLYASGRPLSRALVQVADVFGKHEVLDAVRLSELAANVTKEIRRQVQWTLHGEQVVAVAEQWMVHTIRLSDKVLSIHRVGLNGLHAIANHGEKLDVQSLQNLTSAVLEMIRNDDNYCENRAALLSALRLFEKLYDAPARALMVAKLEPLARGEILESSHYAKASEDGDPRNAFRFNNGDPEDVQYEAILTMAAFSAHGTTAFQRVTDTMELVLCDSRPKIRQAGYEAAGSLAIVSEGIVLGILSGLRDRDDRVAAAAFGAFSNQTEWKLNRNHCQAFLMAARIAQRTGNASLRSSVASACSAWLRMHPRMLKDEQMALLDEIRKDVCWSVRRNANQQLQEE